MFGLSQISKYPLASSSGVVFSCGISESISAVSSEEGFASRFAAFSESSTSSVSITPALIRVGDVVSAETAAHSVTSAWETVGAVSEPATAAHSNPCLLSSVASVSEDASGGEALQKTVSLTGEVSESITALHQTDVQNLEAAASLVTSSTSTHTFSLTLFVPVSLADPASSSVNQTAVLEVPGEVLFSLESLDAVVPQLDAASLVDASLIGSSVQLSQLEGMPTFNSVGNAESVEQAGDEFMREPAFSEYSPFAVVDSTVSVSEAAGSDGTFQATGQVFTSSIEHVDFAEEELLQLLAWEAQIGDALQGSDEKQVSLEKNAFLGESLPVWDTLESIFNQSGEFSEPVVAQEVCESQLNAVALLDFPLFSFAPVSGVKVLRRLPTTEVYTPLYVSGLLCGEDEVTLVTADYVLEEIV